VKITEHAQAQVKSASKFHLQALSQVKTPVLICCLRRERLQAIGMFSK
jgi:hypothetical protein